MSGYLVWELMAQTTVSSSSLYINLAMCLIPLSIILFGFTDHSNLSVLEALYSNVQ